jgi:hypothetical protein
MTLTVVSDEQLQVVALVLAGVAAASDELNRLDSVAGDGDLGVTATTATAALSELLGESETSAPTQVLRQCGMTLAMAAP